VSFRVEFIEGPDKGLIGSLDATKGATIGRGPAADIVVSDKRASRLHCRVSVHTDHFVIEDLGSRNGTFVNDQRVIEANLRVDDIVRIGLSTFKLVEREDAHDGVSA